MTTERFDIEVRDSVAKSIRTELAAIGGVARTTHQSVRELNRELIAGARAAAASAQSAAVQVSGVAGRTAAAQARATAETARATAAQARLTGEQTKAGIAAERLAQAEAKTALAKQKVATESARTAEAQSRANIAYLNEEVALNRAVQAEQRAIQSKKALALASTQVAEAEQRSVMVRDRTTVAQAPAGTLGGTTGSRSDNGAQGDLMRRSTAGVHDNTQALGANTTAAQVAGAAQASYAARTQVAGNSSRLAAHHSSNLLFQLNDVFVSLASGQKPMMVAIQQGAQIAQINQQAGISWKQMGVEVLTMLRIIERSTEAHAAAELASASLAARNLATSAAIAAANVAQADTEIALAMAQRQTATTAAQTTAAEARLALAHEAAAVAAAEQTVAEQALAVAQGRQAAASTAAGNATVTRLGVVGRAAAPAALALGVVTLGLSALNRQANDTSGLKKYTEEMGYTAKEVKKLNAVTVSFGDTTKAVFQVGVKRVLSAFGTDVDAMASRWNSAMNSMSSGAKTAMAGAYAALAGTAKAGKEIWRAGTMGGTISLDEFKQFYRDAYADANKFMDDVVSQSRANARARQDEMAEEMFSAPRSKKDRKGGGWDRAKELRQANDELDVQIGLLSKYGTELERAQQIEQIGRQFRENNAPLTATEVRVLDEKIRKLQEGRRVQEAMTAAEEAANGPARAYSATQEALNRLLQAGTINQEEYNRQLTLADRALRDATEPLAAMNRELEKNGELLGQFGRGRDLASFIQQMEEAAEAQGRSIYQGGGPTTEEGGDYVVRGRGRLTDDAQGMVDEYRRQQQRQEYTDFFEQNDSRSRVGDTSYVLENAKELYAELARLREEDVVSEEEAQQRKRDLDTAYNDARLEGASSIFGQLAALSDSKNRKLAAMGKAAAIAEATIDGIRATQKALAAPPGPPVTIPMAVATAAMSAANVAKIAGIGFRKGGYTGYGADDDIAGPVHRNEYVFDAAATRRLGVPALEAIRSGRTFQPANDQGYGGPRVVIKPQPGVYVEERMTPTGDIEVIAERVARRVAPDAVADNIHKSPNSKVSKAVQTNYGVTRNRP